MKRNKLCQWCSAAACRALHLFFPSCAASLDCRRVFSASRLSCLARTLSSFYLASSRLATWSVLEVDWLMIVMWRESTHFPEENKWVNAQETNWDDEMDLGDLKNAWVSINHRCDKYGVWDVGLQIKSRVDSNHQWTLEEARVTTEEDTAQARHSLMLTGRQVLDTGSIRISRAVMSRLPCQSLMTSRVWFFEGGNLRAVCTLWDDTLLVMGPVPLGIVLGSLHFRQPEKWDRIKRTFNNVVAGSRGKKWSPKLFQIEQDGH